jgi:hypothetical protein
VRRTDFFLPLTVLATRLSPLRAMLNLVQIQEAQRLTHATKTCQYLAAHSLQLRVFQLGWQRAQ